jgi:hypothetical protein
MEISIVGNIVRLNVADSLLLCCYLNGIGVDVIHILNLEIINVISIHTLSQMCTFDTLSLATTGSGWPRKALCGQSTINSDDLTGNITTSWHQ